MLKIAEEELNYIIHELIRISSILKAIENGNITEGQRQILHGCETRLLELREDILKAIKQNNNKSEEG